MNFLAKQLGFSSEGGSSSSTAPPRGQGNNESVSSGFHQISEYEIVNSISSDMKASSVLKFLKILQPLGIYDPEREKERIEKGAVRDPHARKMLLDLAAEHARNSEGDLSLGMGMGLSTGGGGIGNNFGNIGNINTLNTGSHMGLGTGKASFGNSTVDLKSLANHLWNGAPFLFPEMRGHSWRLLLQIAPNSKDRHDSTLKRKRTEYHDLVKQYCSAKSIAAEDSEDQVLRRQIKVDLPRTCAGYLYNLFQTKEVQGMMERILFVWAQRHPACSYVQGINDLLSVFIAVFLCEQQYYFSDLSDSSGNTGNSNSAAGGGGKDGNANDPAHDGDSGAGASNNCDGKSTGGQGESTPQRGGNNKNQPGSAPQSPGTRANKSLVNLSPDKVLKTLDITLLTEQQLADVEADSYYCLTKVMGAVQDHYTAGQPGIQRMVRRVFMGAVQDHYTAGQPGIQRMVRRVFMGAVQDHYTAGQPGIQRMV